MSVSLNTVWSLRLRIRVARCRRGQATPGPPKFGFLSWIRWVWGVGAAEWADSVGVACEGEWWRNGGQVRRVLYHFGWEDIESRHGDGGFGVG